MSSSISPNRNTLLHPKLIHKPQWDEAKALIAQAENPIVACQARSFTINKSFFPHLAEVLRLEYVNSLDTPILGNPGIGSQIPAQLLIDHQIYVYEDRDQLICATANPYQDEMVWEEILAYTGKRSCKIVIANPEVVARVISYQFHIDMSVTSAETIHVLHRNKSAITYNNLIFPKLFPVGFFILIIILFVIFPIQTASSIFIILNILYFVINPFKFYAMIKSFRSKIQLNVSNHEISQIDTDNLPIYTILVPLRNEVDMVPSIVDGIFAIDYPLDKLDIKFICDVDDQSTIAALEAYGIGVPSESLTKYSFTTQLVKVPLTGMSSKPRACDYALGFSRGQLTVIFDAEDKPDKDQLKKVYLGFLKSPLDIMCIQARLNFYNSRQNLLTRFFSLEYGFWFDYYLPGLQDTGSPIPLGGTSNHFVTQYLKRSGTWDPFNVTEDADLGFRIFRYKMRTSMVNSYTQEEANSRIISWIRQRTRWQKGYLLTFLIHTSRPKELIRDLGIRKSLQAIMIFGGNFFLPLFNPVLWVIFLVGIIPQNSFVQMPQVPLPIYLIGLFNLIVGNVTFITIHLIAAFKSKRYDLAVVSLFLPFYWMLLSLATFRAAYQFATNPFYWEKTKHGLSKSKR